MLLGKCIKLSLTDAFANGVEPQLARRRDDSQRLHGCVVVQLARDWMSREHGVQDGIRQLLPVAGVFDNDAAGEIQFVWVRVL
jgi:hypothetical protein